MKKKKSKKKYILIAGILFLMLIFLALTIFSFKNRIFTGKAINEEKEYTVFYFYLNKTKNPVDGELYTGDYFLGKTKNGNFSVTLSSNLTGAIRFKGTYNKSKFDLTYTLPKDFRRYNAIPFVVSEKDMTQDDFYYSVNMHWGHMPVTYGFKNYCSNKKRIISAFNEISNSTNGTVYFVQTNSSNPDLTIICYPNKSQESNHEKEILGESALSNIKDNLIVNSTIYFYSTISSCGYFPLVEIHEILHSFGFEHSPKISSVMYNTTENCKWMYENQNINGAPKIDRDIIEKLIKTYQKNNSTG